MSSPNSSSRRRRVTREYFNDSKLDYFESEIRACHRCKRRFLSQRTVLSDRPCNEFPDHCFNCVVCSHLTDFPLLTPTEQNKRTPKKGLPVFPAEVETARDWVLRGLLLLQLYAEQGNNRSIEVLVEFGFLSTWILELVARRTPEVLRPWARQSMSWPMFLGPKRNRHNDHLLKALQVAAETPVGRWQPEAPTTAAALLMSVWLTINQVELKLPPLSKFTAKRWFEAGWHGLLFATHGAPESDDLLGKIGTHRRGHSERNNLQRKATSRTDKCNVRDGIKKQLWQSFKNFIPPKN